LSVTMKHITQSLGQPATLHHPVKHTHTHSVCEKEEHLSKLASVYMDNHVPGSPLTQTVHYSMCIWDN